MQQTKDKNRYNEIKPGAREKEELIYKKITYDRVLWVAKCFYRRDLSFCL